MVGREELSEAERIFGIVDNLYDTIPEIPDTLNPYVTALISARDDCRERGFHRVRVETTEFDNPMVCYDCDLWFNKTDAELGGIEYRVVPWEK